MPKRFFHSKSLYFNDFHLRLFGIPIVAFVLSVVFIQQQNQHHWQDFLRVFSVSFFYTFTFWEGNRWIMLHLQRKFPDFKDNKKRLLHQGIWVVSFVLLVTLIGQYFIDPIIIELFPHKHQEGFLQKFYISLSTTITVVAIYETIYHLSRWKHTLLEAEALKRENTQAQLEALKSQVNPHFLFNSLNTLSQMIHEDPDLSVDFIQKLSKVYRYILEIREKELVPLGEEMECIEAYQFMLGIRFGDNFRMEIDIPPERMKECIVPLSLQILIENAIKHNIVSSAKPLTIKMSLNADGQLSVTNKLQRKKQVMDSTKTGLSNIKKRYKMITDQEVEVIQSREYFRVIVPLIQINTYERTDH